mmetsp:Transcript_2365/g.6625  ORF Transcript_2365/g.6625 Transcript_2365/m.6625 type:complete len:332 (+) Transcript_2365:502-1497(+)
MTLAGVPKGTTRAALTRQPSPRTWSGVSPTRPRSSSSGLCAYPSTGPSMTSLLRACRMCSISRAQRLPRRHVPTCRRSRRHSALRQGLNAASLCAPRTGPSGRRCRRVATRLAGSASRDASDARWSTEPASSMSPSQLSRSAARACTPATSARTRGPRIRRADRWRSTASRRGAQHVIACTASFRTRSARQIPDGSVQSALPRLGVRCRESTRTCPSMATTMMAASPSRHCACAHQPTAAAMSTGARAARLARARSRRPPHDRMRVPAQLPAQSQAGHGRPPTPRGVRAAFRATARRRRSHARVAACSSREARRHSHRSCSSDLDLKQPKS